ncbi:MAG: hypothetical protein ACRC5T_03705 [Cetobacterium sp.]
MIGSTAGTLNILVNAITSGFANQIRDGFRGTDRIASGAARDMAKAFNRDIQKLNADRPLGRIAERLREIAPEADRTYRGFIRLVRASYGLQAGIGAIVGSIGSVLSGIVAIGANAAGAIPSVVALGGALGALLVGLRVGTGAFKGIGGALAALKAGGGGGGGASAAQATDDALRNLALTIERNQKRIVEANNAIRTAQLRLNEAFAEGREQIQQLGFEAEDAALAERRAALELEKARAELLRTQDLPPNSRIRRNAELAFQQAELDYRQAVDRASDLAQEQDRLAQSGVEGTDVVIQAREDLAEAEENLRDVVLESLRAQEDAQRRLDDARNGSGGGGGGGVDPLAGLTESQKRFVLFLKNEVIPTFFSLKEAAADGFLPILEEQIRRFYQAGAFERLRVGIASVSSALADATVAFMDVFLTERNLRNFSQFFEDSARIIPQFGKVFGNSLRIVLTLLAAAAPVTERFVNWIDRATASYAAFLDQGQATGELTAYLNSSADLMARWGAMFGDIFGAIGKIIKANVGPGSGGDILLSWLERAFNNLNSLDSTFLELYFANVGKNFTEILDGFNIIVDAMLEAGANPAVGEFWRILQAGGGALQQVVRDSVNAAPLLAKIINSLFQMVAVFADAGPLNAFLEVLGFMAAGASALVQALRPLLLVLGPIFAAASALGLAFALANKVFVITVGFMRNALAPFTAMTGALLGQAASAKGLAVAQRNLAISELELEMIRRRAAVANAVAAVQRATALADTTALTAANARLAVATNGLEVATQKAGIAATTTGTLMKLALGPIGWIVAGLTAAISGIFVAVAIQQQNMDKAVEATTEAIKNNLDATQQWENALLSVANGAAKDALDSVDGLGAGIASLNDTIITVDRLGRSVDGMSQSAADLETATRKALTAFGKSLANVAGTDLPAAQRAFRELARTQSLSVDETRRALAEMPEYRAELLAQADAMGIQLRNSEGVVDSTLQLEFAMGQGEIAIRNQTQALEEQTARIVSAAAESANLFEVAKVGAEEGQVDFDTFLQQLRDKSIFTSKEIAAALELEQIGLSEGAIELLRTSGLSAQEILEEVKSEGANIVAETNLLALKSTGAFDKAIQEMQNNGLSSIEIAAKYALEQGLITIDEFIALTGAKFDGYTPEVEIEANTEAFRGIEAKIRSFIPGQVNVPVGLSLRTNGQFRFVSQAVKDGGMILPAFANGGFFSGLGPVTGAGGPRDDKVPAMLSAGEYVVNALATKRYRPLLEALNGGSPTFANPTAGAGASSGVNVSITVNPSAGMNEHELAKMVSQELARELRKGSAF